MDSKFSSSVLDSLEVLVRLFFVSSGLLSTSFSTSLFFRLSSLSSSFLTESAVESGSTFSLDSSRSPDSNGGAVAGIGEPSVNRRLGGLVSVVAVVVVGLSGDRSRLSLS